MLGVDFAATGDGDVVTVATFAAGDDFAGKEEHLDVENDRMVGDQAPDEARDEEAVVEPLVGSQRLRLLREARFEPEDAAHVPSADLDLGGGRLLHVPKSLKGVAVFSFKKLCGGFILRDAVAR